VRNPVPFLWILGGKPVHDTTSWGEQTGKHQPTLIRRRFVPALTGRLTAKAENILSAIKGALGNINNFIMLDDTRHPAPIVHRQRLTAMLALHESGQFGDSASGEFRLQKSQI
jgi:hypothetical protein